MTLEKDSLYDICNICEWQNDPVYDNGWLLSEEGGPNDVSLEQARKNYEKYGTSLNMMLTR